VNEDANEPIIVERKLLNNNRVNCIYFLFYSTLFWGTHILLDGAACSKAYPSYIFIDNNQTFTPPSLLHLNLKQRKAESMY
jgi:hypothetical protein